MEPQHSEQRSLAGTAFDGSVIEMLGDKIKQQNRALNRLTNAIKALPPDCYACLAKQLAKLEPYDD